MRITTVDILPIGGAGRGSSLLVLGTDASLVGIGELSGNGRSDAARASADVATMLVGRDPFDSQALAAQFGSDGGSRDLALLAAASTAMADLCGQQLGVPAHQFLGGRVRDRVRVCAIDWTDGASSLDELKRAARRTVDAGFEALSAGPLIASPSLDAADPGQLAASIEALRDEVPDNVDLVVAADGALQGNEIAALGDRLAAFEPLWLECRLDRNGPTRHGADAQVAVPLASSRTTPVAALQSLLAAGRLDHIVLDVGMVGGLQEARRISALAELYHVGIVPSGSTPVSLAIAMHVAAVIPNLTMVQMRPGLAQVVDGRVDVDLSSGLGVDMERATRMEVV